jgi:hypothetical protein
VVSSLSFSTPPLYASLLHHCRCRSPPSLRSNRRRTAPPSLTRLAAHPPPPTRLEEASSDDSPLASSGYNDECPHVKEVISYELLLDFNCLLQLLNIHIHFHIQKLEKKLVVAEKELQHARNVRNQVDCYLV